MSEGAFRARRELERLADPAKARVLSRFFKTGPGEYGEGDRFLGITVPKTRSLAKKYRDLGFGDLRKLLSSKIHEARLLALLILVDRFETGNPGERRKIYRFYVKHLKFVNNWDLVDLSAPKIVGNHLFGRDIAPLLKWAGSKRLWERRTAIVATLFFIRKGRCGPALRIARRLLGDGEDLIRKAAGWMLREAGKRDLRALESFLERHRAAMPRTMLRYAVERFPPAKRKRYLRLAGPA